MKASFVNALDAWATSLFLHKRTQTLLNLPHAWMTLQVGIRYFVVLIFCSTNYLKGTGMTVISSIENVNTPIAINFHQKQFMIHLTESDYPLDPELLHHFNGPESSMNIPLEPCQFDRHFNKSEYRSLIKVMNISEYLCKAFSHNIPSFFIEI